MTNETLKGLKVAILVTDGFERVELVRPRKALDQAGAQTQIVSPQGGSMLRDVVDSAEATVQRRRLGRGQRVFSAF